MEYPHGDLLHKVVSKKPELKQALTAYDTFVSEVNGIEVVDNESIKKLVAALNKYRESSIYIFEAGDNVPQENLRSTIMEEFLIWLFKDIFKILDFKRPSNFQIGKTSGSYLSLEFAPTSFRKMFANPGHCIQTKDQDFSIGANFNIQITNADGESSSDSITLPVVAVECKTYLAKNHLDMCASTATSLKRAIPYCKYIIVSEFLKLSNDATPEFTDISEIFVVCKANNTDRKKRKDAGLSPHIVHDDVVIKIFDMIVAHLKAIWWNPNSVLENGTVIGRPN